MNIVKTAGFDRNILTRWCVLIGITLVFIVTLYPNLVIKQHSYQLGDVAEKNVKAPKDFFVEDQDATEEKRLQAVDAILTVYDYDQQATSKTIQTVTQAFTLLRSVYTAAGETDGTLPEKQDTAPRDENMPDAVVGPLAEASQETSANIEQAIEAATSPSPDQPAAMTPSPDKQAQRLKPDFEKMLGIAFNDEEFKILMKNSFSGAISGPVIHIYREVHSNGVVANKELLLKELDRGITLRNIKTRSEQTVDSLRSYYGLEQAKTMVRIIGDPLLKDHGYQQRDLIVAIVQRLITPNITLNKSETEERKREAESAIKPILYQIKAGEMILREGERVTPVQVKKLDAMQTLVHEDQIFAQGLGACLILVSFMVVIYLIHTRSSGPFDDEQYKHLLLVGCLLAVQMIIAKAAMSFSETMALQGSLPDTNHSVYFGVPIAIGSVIVCLFLGLEGAMGFSLLGAVTATILFENRLDLFIYYYLNSILGAYWVQNCRERKVFIQAGLKLGLFNIVLASAICLYTTELSAINMLWNAAFAFLGGIGVGIIALGLAPLIEIGFGFKTDITLLELSNLDQPILKKLMIDAPGTYHHSIIVGSLVEAAAAEIGANPLLAKVCAYYHDIGKINKPLYFVENQREGKNRHDKLAPSMSSLILISHIKHGCEIASKYKLGKQIKDTIRQHHGTSLIQYFYDKAKQLRGEENVKIDDFRYPGPKPQTREAGLVMLADVVEAASRTLEMPTPSRIQGLVQNLISKVFSDGQLDNCELTLRDLHNIAKSFNKILNGIYHHRIEYSESPAPGNGKGKDASSDRQQAKQENGADEKDRAGRKSHLKRLGLS
jgi:putative nucleotidyltransferase with HDIG domain